MIKFIKKELEIEESRIKYNENQRETRKIKIKMILNCSVMFLENVKIVM